MPGTEVVFDISANPLIAGLSTGSYNSVSSGRNPRRPLPEKTRKRLAELRAAKRSKLKREAMSDGEAVPVLTPDVPGVPVPVVGPEKRKRGRPRKNPVVTTPGGDGGGATATVPTTGGGETGGSVGGTIGAGGGESGTVPGTGTGTGTTVGIGESVGSTGSVVTVTPPTTPQATTRQTLGGGIGTMWGG